MGGPGPSGSKKFQKRLLFKSSSDFTEGFQCFFFKVQEGPTYTEARGC